MDMVVIIRVSVFRLSLRCYAFNAMEEKLNLGLPWSGQKLSENMKMAMMIITRGLFDQPRINLGENQVLL